MTNLTDRIKFIAAPNQARFPYCNCLLIEDDVRVLIDSSCGREKEAWGRKHGDGSLASLFTLC